MTAFDRIYAETYGTVSRYGRVVYLCHRCGRIRSRTRPCRVCAVASSTVRKED